MIATIEGTAMHCYCIEGTLFKAEKVWIFLKLWKNNQIWQEIR